MSGDQLCLASGSPRRAELLRQLGVRFRVVVSGVPEAPSPGQSPSGYALQVAEAKARAVSLMSGELPVLGADTDVVIDGEILGKPRNRQHALDMLKRLSAREHRVFSAVALVFGERCETVLTETVIEFGDISGAEAAEYWDSGEPSDKAGAYAIQGKAARWVRSIRGSYSGVVGLPLYETAQLLKSFQISMPLRSQVIREPGSQ